VVEAALKFGSKDEFQSLSNDLSSFERSRRSLADRLDNLSASKEAELNRLRMQVKNLATATQPPKKVIVDDTEPVKKPTKKKTAPKTAKPATGVQPSQQPTQPQ